MEFKEIKNNIFYCGLNDYDRVYFDELIPLEHGTSYNSYLIKGSEKTALIDTMYPPFADVFLENFDKNNVSNIDYIIANHGEQDHSGSLPFLLDKFPGAKIVTNAKCKENIKEMLLIDDEEKFITVSDNDTISLGDKTLKFILAPGVHWPDTMFTHLIEDNLIFTCDFLGAHLPSEDLFSKDDDELYSSAKRYYAEIMMPFRFMCKKYTKLWKDIMPDMILPSHGPVYNNPSYILDCYEDWSADEPKNLVVIPYVSMYKSVEEMVFYVADKLKEKGVQALPFDIVDGDLGLLATYLVDAATIIIGTSMVLANPHPMAANAAYIVNLLKPKAKFASFIGSYGWGGNLFGKLQEILNSIKPQIIEPVLVKGKPKEKDFKLLDDMVDNIYAKHKEIGLVK